MLSILEVPNGTDNYIVKNTMGKYLFTSKSVEYGKSQDPVARGRYIKYVASRYSSFHCFKTGIFVYKDFPYLADFKRMQKL